MQTKKLLIKYGGNAMTNQSLKSEIAKQLLVLTQAGYQVTLVHGGGPFINKALEAANIRSEFYDGQRKTTSVAFFHIEKTLIGEVNTELVGIFNQLGLKAVGLSGKDGNSVTAVKYFHESVDGKGNPIQVDLGQVGRVETVDTALLELLLAAGFTPVMTCIANDKDGNGFNINGDTFAGQIAAALQVDQYILLTDVDGLFLDFPDPQSIIRELRLSDLSEHYGSTIKGGMIPKIKSCEEAVLSGVRKAVILNGTQPDQLSRYILENESLGTTLIP